MGKSERKIPVGKPRRILEDNINNRSLKNRMRWYGLESSSSGGVEVSCEHSNEPSDSIECWEIPE
jgi:hypothetical protein